MTTRTSSLDLTIDGLQRKLDVNQQESLLDVLRRYRYYSVKRGCDTGDCGVCTVLLNGQPVRSCMVPATRAEGKSILTIEGFDEDGKLHPIQQAFIETGAVQCGFCSPALMLTTYALLKDHPHPTDDDVLDALSGVLCRCTGYVRILEAVQRAAAVLRGEEVPDLDAPEYVFQPGDAIQVPDAYRRPGQDRHPLPPLIYTPAGMEDLKVVGTAQEKVDGVKLAKGKAVFTDDMQLPGMLYGALLTSPHAHARINDINTTKAESLPGVHAVLTHRDIPRVKHASGGQSHPQPPPYDQACLDNKVRYVGDRVAVVAAESLETARKALELIEVDYEILPPVLDPMAWKKGEVPVIHDEEDTEDLYDRERNIVHHIEAEVGDVDQAFKEADAVFTRQYRTPKQQHAHLEPHVCITYWDEDDRLVIRTSTQVPFHIRRMVAPLIGIPEKHIRVIKPRIGGGFGAKQEMILEDLCAHLTLTTGHPVRMEYTRTQEFTSSRSRHNNLLWYKVAVKDEKVTGAGLYMVGDTGAYGSHGLTVQMVGGFKGLTLYNPPHASFVSDVVYTNKPPTGAFRGYGAMQCQFGIEVMMEEIAQEMGLDVVDFKRKNWLQLGEKMHLAKALGEGREGYEQKLESSAFEECVSIGLQATDFYAKREAYKNQRGTRRKGIGMAVVMHGSGIAGLDMASATLKMNDDGSFNMLMGATDLGTGSDTILAQMAAEVLGIPVEDLIVYSSDTDFTPFDKGAYASSTTYISGGAVRKAAEKIKRQIQEHAAMLLEVDQAQELELVDRKVVAPDGSEVSLREVALSSLHQENQHQIMATASHMSYKSPPPTAAQFAEIEVDTETGQITVDRLLMVVDCGRVINPRTAAGQVEGGMAQALGFTLSEDMEFNDKGEVVNADFSSYHILTADEMPAMDVIFVQTDEPSGPFGAKSVAELSIDGVAPAMVSALHDATGVWVRELPLYPERVWRALHGEDS